MFRLRPVEPTRNPPHDRLATSPARKRGRHRQHLDLLSDLDLERRPKWHGATMGLWRNGYVPASIRRSDRLPPVHRALRRRHPGTPPPTYIEDKRNRTATASACAKKSARRHTMDSRHRARRHKPPRPTSRSTTPTRSPQSRTSVPDSGRHHLPARRDGHAHRDPHTQPRQPARRGHPHQTLHLRQGPALDPAAIDATQVAANGLYGWGKASPTRRDDGEETGGYSPQDQLRRHQRPLESTSKTPRHFAFLMGIPGPQRNPHPQRADAEFPTADPNNS